MNSTKLIINLYFTLKYRLHGNNSEMIKGKAKICVGHSTEDKIYHSTQTHSTNRNLEVEAIGRRRASRRRHRESALVPNFLYAVVQLLPTCFLLCICFGYFPQYFHQLQFSEREEIPYEVIYSCYVYQIIFIRKIQLSISAVNW